MAHMGSGADKAEHCAYMTWFFIPLYCRVLKRHCLRKCSRSKKWGSTDFLQTYPRGYTWSDITKYNLVLFSGILL